jgi:hypothetical protein
MLLDMPDHLRKTKMTLDRFGRATAEIVACETKRARAVESAYLNQLVLMGLVQKERDGRKVYFSVNDCGDTWENSFAEMKRLPYSIQRMLVDDMATAFKNRIQVLLKAAKLSF